MILGITLVGEWLNVLLPLPVPAGVYGLFLMQILLCTGVLKLRQVEATGNFLLDIMPVMFVPAAAGLTDSFKQLQPVLVPVVGICVISTLIVMAVTGKTADLMIERRERYGKKKRYRERKKGEGER